MIAIGVGGADAVDVLAGMGWELKFPKIIGIKLTGKLSGCLCQRHYFKNFRITNSERGTGNIIEYFGDGA